MEQKNLVELFKTYTDLKAAPIIVLQNINHVPVAALYMDKLRDKDFIIMDSSDNSFWSENSEKYYLVIKETAGIFFTYFQKYNS